ncbi:hypothetical protein AUP68_12584 [Ilyonectria robusta]
MARKPLRILCFGDSLTSGYFCFGMDSHPYSLKLEDKLTGALPGVDVETVTNGVPGDVATFKRFTDRMRDESHIPFHSLSEDDREKYWDDGLHLRDDGYDWMGGHIANALISIIKQGGEPGPATSTARRRSSRPSREESSLLEETGNPRNISEGYVVVRKKDLD